MIFTNSVAHMRTKEVRKTRIFMKIHQISNRLRHVGVSQNPEKSKIEFGGQNCVENPSEHDALSFRSIRGRESVEKSILVTLLAFFDHFPHIYGILEDHSYRESLTLGGF